MKTKLAIIATAVILAVQVNGQEKPDYSGIDMMFVAGDYNKVIDTCSQILKTDSVNAAIHYKMGLAYQNLMPDDKSFDCFLKSYAIAPENNLYKFTVAKGYFNKNKNHLARPLLIDLCASDTLNWLYAHFLTSICMEEGKYDESINIYNKFHKQDSSNYLYLDKLGFAYLRKGDFPKAIDLYSRSLEINNKNLNAIRNLSYLYPLENNIDTAIYLLTKGIEIDPEDMDLYARRATIYFGINYNKRALNDYLRILASGDSSFLYLKRAGIGYTNNLQTREALKYLHLASKKDSTDYETLSYIAGNYNKLHDFKNSQLYYDKVIEILSPLAIQLGMTHFLLAEVYKSSGSFKEAIPHYIKGQELTYNPSMSMVIANLYDEKLNNLPKAIYYYRQFLSNVKNSKQIYGVEYLKSIEQRVVFLEEKLKTDKKQ